MEPCRRPLVRLGALASLSLILVLVSQIPRAWGESGIIITVAGGGSIGDGGQATSAQLFLPMGVTVDAAGSIFIADTNYHRIRQVVAGTGIISTVAGTGAYGLSGDGGLATSAQLSAPYSVAVSAARNLFIADAENHRIRRVAADTGIISTVAGTGVAGFSGDDGPATSARLSTPTGVAVSVGGDLFIADVENNRIRQVNLGTGIITTVAGTGVAGFSGDGGPAASAQLWAPTGVAVDAAGNLFIADAGNNRIRRVARGTITTVAGTGEPGFGGDGGPATSAHLSVPYSVAVDAAGDLFIADISNVRIRQVAASTGIITTVAGTGILGFSGDGDLGTLAKLSSITSVAIDAAGNLLIADAGNHRIRQVAASTGVITTVAGTGVVFTGDGDPATIAQLRTPTGLAFDVVGNLFISDAGTNRIHEVAAGTGIITTVAGTGVAGFFGDGAPATDAQLSTPTGVAVSLARNLFIADADNHRIRRVAADTGIITTVAGTGSPGFSGDDGPATGARLSTPTGVTVSLAGNLFIADAENHRIRRVDLGTGIITTVAGTGGAGFGGDGGPATSAVLNFPYYVAFDAAGNLFVSDQGNFRIRRVAADTGIITTVAGTGIPGFSGDGGPAISAQLTVPYGVAVDAAGNLFIADQGNFRVRKVAAGTGIITTVAGTGISGFSGDGGPATSAQLGVAYGVATDAAGDLFFADSSNNRVRAVDLAVAVPPPVITSGPPNPTDDTSATFFFASAGSGIVRFSCRLDSGGFTPCLSPKTYPGPFTVGEHTFQVTVTDQFGDTSAPATYTWTTTTPVFTLTVTKQGTGSGVVTSTPAGISCGAACSANYRADTLVTLIATPNPGSTFVGWSGGGCPGTDACIVTIAATTAVTANFSRIFLLTVTSTGTGNGIVTSNPAGISCGAACSAPFVSGTAVTLTATPGANSVFTGWSGGGCAGSGGCVVTVSDATTVTATFTSVYALTVSIIGAGAGTVASTPAGITCGAACSASFVSGTVVTLTATPDGGSTFVGWSGGGCPGTAPCTLSLGAATAVTATFNVTGPFTFTDPNLVGGRSLIKAIHIEELRNAINTARTSRRLAAFSFTDPNLMAGSTTVKKVHIAELRTALDGVYDAVGAQAQTYTDPTLGVGTTVMKAVHIRELRSAVQTVP